MFYQNLTTRYGVAIDSATSFCLMMPAKYGARIADYDSTGGRSNNIKVYLNAGTIHLVLWVLLPCQLDLLLLLILLKRRTTNRSLEHIIQQPMDSIPPIPVLNGTTPWHLREVWSLGADVLGLLNILNFLGTGCFVCDAVNSPFQHIATRAMILKDATLESLEISTQDFPTLSQTL